jgi:3-hydroxyisobutyrate dehydrogenase
MSLGYLKEKDVDVNLFMDILRESALYAPTFDKKFSNMLERKFTNPNFPLKHLLKDVNLIIDEFVENKIDCTPLKGVKGILLKAVEDGNSELDYSALYNSVYKIK